MEVGAESTVFQLKEKISKDYRGNPTLTDQRILHQGRLLRDSFKIKDAQLSVHHAIVLHLMIRGDSYRCDNAARGSKPALENLGINPFVPLMTNQATHFPHPYLGQIGPTQPIIQYTNPLATTVAYSASMHPDPNQFQNSIPEQNGPVPQPDGQVDEKKVQLEPERTWVQRYVNIKLAAKLMVLIILFGQDGNRTRLLVLCAVAVITYFYQVGFLSYIFGAPNRGRVVEGNGVPDIPQAAEQDQNVQNGGGVADNPIVRRETSTIMYIERFIVGFFASLIPSWTPTTI